MTKLSFSEIPFFSRTDKAYQLEDPTLAPFYRFHSGRLGHYAEAAATRQFPETHRAVLVETLGRQYQHLPASEATKNNLRLLALPNTFTVTTAHQPSLFTGPLYFVYKILNACRLAKDLSAAFPQYNFVPIYWNGGEDHDFAEINHAKMFGKTLAWAEDRGGSVSQYPTGTMGAVVEELRSVLGDTPKAKEVFEQIQAAYTGHSTYGTATNDLVNRLLGHFGIITIDPMDPALKALMVPVFKEELRSQTSFRLVNETLAHLETAGFRAQAPPREINLFYLAEGSRERIVKEDGFYKILNTNTVLTEEEILRNLENHPERFSPNVILRPLYQTSVLPDVAFVGGGAEVAYWLERKALFEHFGVPFPILVRRSSMLLLDGAARQKLAKLGMGAQELFGEEHEWVNLFLSRQTTDPMDFEKEYQALDDLFAQVIEKARRADATLVGAAEAEKQKAKKILEQLEGRLVRAEKQKHETALNQLRTLREKLFPGGGLQERVDNFLPFYLKFEGDFFEHIYLNSSPLEFGFGLLDV